MSDLKPTEQELKAADWLKVYDFPPEWWTDEARVRSIATAIATHTRHEGKTAKEWAERADEYRHRVKLEWIKRAEASERELATVQAERDGLADYLNRNYRYSANDPQIAVVEKAIEHVKAMRWELERLRDVVCPADIESIDAALAKVEGK